MRGRPPIKPSHNLVKQPSSDEENDTVEDLGTFHAPPARLGLNYSPLPLSECFEQVFSSNNIPIYWSGSNGPVVLCLHGAGLSASSFAPAAMISKNIPVQLVSFDFRGHGQYPESDLDNDLSSANLVSDGLNVLSFIRSRNPDVGIVLIGHSMGGAIASKLAVEDQNRGGRLAGLIIVDVVEGQALSALPHMEAIINQKPKSFKSVEKAIEWAYSSNTIRKLESARVSIPVQLKSVPGAVVWRTDLKKTQPFWEEWFRGMNNAFLSFQGPKELIIAENDRVDQQMMIAQMQGKYKHRVFFNVGHMVQEDDPKKFVEEIRTFVTTFKILG